MAKFFQIDPATIHQEIAEEEAAAAASQDDQQVEVVR
jgi:hypothetical protein